MRLCAIGTVFVQLILGPNAFITGRGFAKMGMTTVLIGAVAKIVLDPIFLFALILGVQGAVLATVLSQGLSCAWVIAFLCGRKTVLRLSGSNLLKGLSLLPPCIALGMSSFVMQSSESIITVCFSSSLLRYGGGRFCRASCSLPCCARFIFGAQTACQMPFISTGNALSSIIVAVLRKFLLPIPLINLMPHLMGDQTTAVYLAELVADGLAAIFTVTLFRYQFRKSLRSMEHQIGGIPEKRTPACPDRTAGVQPVPKGCAPFYRALRRHSSFCR
mgnify:CR=1 FL=1